MGDERMGIALEGWKTYQAGRIEAVSVDKTSPRINCSLYDKVSILESSVPE